jgi:Fe-S cluster biogenesis protein NfuA
MGIAPEKLEEALEVLRPGLDSDGFELTIEEIGSDGRISVALTATPEACMDCLVPDEMMVSMIQGIMQEMEPQVTDVVLKKYGM